MEAISYILGSGPLRPPWLLRSDLTFLSFLGSLLVSKSCSCEGSEASAEKTQ